MLCSCYTKPKNLYETGETVVLIHGIFDKPVVMKKIENNFRELGYRILNFEYASTRWPMDTVVLKLSKEIAAIEPQAEKIHFVTHSLGSLVVRAYLAQTYSEKFGNLVMVAPPNQGSVFAEHFDNLKTFEWLCGPAGQHLGKDDDDYWKKFPEPNIHFGVIAGGLGNEHGINPLIPGDDDGVVAVEETKLDGMADFIIVRGIHTPLLWKKEVVQQILYFIDSGCFLHNE